MSRFTFMKWVKTIRSKDGRLHFRRFSIIETPWFAVYIHRIYEGDRDPHLHSHPWPFWTMVLWGSYTELNEKGLSLRQPFQPISGGYDYVHKIQAIIQGPVTTILIAGKRRKDWYYRVDGNLVRYDKYRSK